MALVNAEDVTPGSDRVYQRRRHARVTVNGSVRLVADTSAGVVTLKGSIIDLSVSGCAIRVYGRLEPRKEARLELQVGGERVWVPGQIVWSRTRERSWVVGVQFERLVPEKQSLITRLVAERSRQARVR
jgi:c-di-GMP-binding flagellar brake protein YcgR